MSYNVFFWDERSGSCQGYYFYNVKYFCFIIQFGSKKTLGGHLGKPTYVFPSSLKRVIREVIPGDLVARPDPSHDRVSSKFTWHFPGFLWVNKIHINQGSCSLVVLIFLDFSKFPWPNFDHISGFGVYFHPFFTKKPG